MQNHENLHKKVIQQWIIIQSSKNVCIRLQQIFLLHTQFVYGSPQIGNCYITNWYSLSYTYKLLDVEMKSVFKASF